jgi:hypothetical protein
MSAALWDGKEIDCLAVEYQEAPLGQQSDGY